MHPTEFRLKRVFRGCNGLIKNVCCLYQNLSYFGFFWSIVVGGTVRGPIDRSIGINRSKSIDPFGSDRSEIDRSIDRGSGGSVVNVGLGRQRRRLSLYIKKAPLCGNGRGLRTHQSCDLGFAGPGRGGRQGLGLLVWTPAGAGVQTSSPKPWAHS